VEAGRPEAEITTRRQFQYSLRNEGYLAAKDGGQAAGAWWKAAPFGAFPVDGNWVIEAIYRNEGLPAESHNVFVSRHK
jgi:hypothetical protein